MNNTYRFNRDVLLSHIEQWKAKQREDRRPSSDRALAQHVGVSHTYIGFIRKGTTGKRPVKRMNYGTGLKFSCALGIRMEFLLPELLGAMDSDKLAA